MPDRNIRNLISVTFQLLGRANSFPAKSDATVSKTSEKSVQSSRKAAIHSMRIEEAGEYLELHTQAFQMFRRTSQTRPAGSSNRLSKTTLDEMVSLFEIALRMGYRIDALEDPVIANLDQRLTEVARLVNTTVIQLVNPANSGEDNTCSSWLDEMSSKNAEAFELIAKMQRRLDFLTRTVR